MLILVDSEQQQIVKTTYQINDLDSLDLYNYIELPLANVLAKMEIEGFPLDEKSLNEIDF